MSSGGEGPVKRGHSRSFTRRVQAGKIYEYRPVAWDSIVQPPYGVRTGFLKEGDKVRVVRLPSAPPPNTMGMAHIETMDGQLAGLVMTNSLVPIPQKEGGTSDEYRALGMRDTSLDGKRQELVNLYRAVWGTNAGLSRETLEHKSGSELDADIRSLRIALANKRQMEGREVDF